MNKKKKSSVAPLSATGTVGAASEKRQAELEAKIKELTAIVDGFRAGEIGAEGRIKALTEMHAKKVKMLLKSIDQLKKENQKEKLLQKDSARAKLIEQYKKDMESQDFIITTLRKVVGDEDKCDRALVGELNKGPDRIRCATREELKMENKKLKAMLQASKEKTVKLELLLTENNANAGGAGNGPNLAGTVESGAVAPGPELRYSVVAGETAENSKKLVALEAELDDLKLKSTTEINEKNTRILEITRELDDCKLELTGRDEKINRTNELVEKLYEELKQKAEAETKIVLVEAKSKAYEQEMQRLLKEAAGKVERTGDVTRDEMELQNIGLLDQLKKQKSELESERTEAKEQIKAFNEENQRLKTLAAELEGELNRLRTEKTDKEAMLGNLQKKIELHDANFEQQKKTTEQSYQQLVDQIGQLKAEKAVLSEKYMKLLVQVEGLESQLQGKNTEVEVYQAKLAEFDKENARLKGNAGEEVDMPLDEEQESELVRLRQKVKELARREVELLEELEKTKEENRDEQDKIKMVHLVSTQKRSTSINRIEEEAKKYKSLYDGVLKKLAKYEQTPVKDDPS